MPSIPNVSLFFDKKKKTTSNTINPRNLVTESYDPLSIEPTNPKVRVRFIEGVTKSIHLEELEFTNKLPSFEEAAVEPYIVNSFEQIKNNHESIKTYCLPINYSGKNKERIKSILCNYINEDKFEQYSDYFLKSDIRAGILLEDRGAFRVISLYQVEPKKHKRQKNSKHYLIVTCIDPYHLFIPSKKHGTKLYKKVKIYSENIEDKYPDLIDPDFD